jgi:hypothetical protein
MICFSLHSEVNRSRKQLAESTQKQLSFGIENQNEIPCTDMSNMETFNTTHPGVSANTSSAIAEISSIRDSKDVYNGLPVNL